jgi:hypothetical protein
LQTFGDDIDRVRHRIEAELGPSDVAYIERVAWVSRGF